MFEFIELIIKMFMKSQKLNRYVNINSDKNFSTYLPYFPCLELVVRPIELKHIV